MINSGLLLLAVIFITPPQQDSMELSLRDTLKLALEKNMGLQLTRLTVKNQEISLERTRAIYEPLVTGFLLNRETENEATTGVEGVSGASFTSTNGSANLTFEKDEFFGLSWNVRFNNSTSDRGDASSLGEVFTTSLAFSATQELLRGISFDPELLRYDEYRVKGERDMSQLDLEVEVSDLLRDTENAYWNLVVARENQAVRQKHLELANKLLSFFKTKVEAGSMAEVDLLLAEGVSSRREVELIQAANAVQAAEEVLKQTINLPIEKWDSVIIPIDPLNAIPITPDADKDIASALAYRTEIKRNTVGLKNARLRARFLQIESRPSLTLGGSYQGAGVSSPNDAGSAHYSEALKKTRNFDLPGWELTLNMSWTPWNKQAKLDKASAAIDLQSEELDLEQTRQLVVQEVKSTSRQVISTWRALAASKISVNIQEKTLDADLKKFDRGLTNIFQISEIQNNLAEAEAELNQAKRAYMNALVDYYRAMGILASKHNIRAG